MNATELLKCIADKMEEIYQLDDTLNPDLHPEGYDYTAEETVVEAKTMELINLICELYRYHREEDGLSHNETISVMNDTVMNAEGWGIEDMLDGRV